MDVFWDTVYNHYFNLQLVCTSHGNDRRKWEHKTTKIPDCGRPHNSCWPHYRTSLVLLLNKLQFSELFWRPVPCLTNSTNDNMVARSHHTIHGTGQVPGRETLTANPTDIVTTDHSKPYPYYYHSAKLTLYHWFVLRAARTWEKSTNLVPQCQKYSHVWIKQRAMGD